MSGDVRTRVAEGLAAAVTPERVEALVEAALLSTKSRWVSVTCRHCGRQQRQEVEVLDAQAAARALSLLADQGLGRAAASEAVSVPVGKPIVEMSREEREAYRRVLLERIGRPEEPGL